MHGAKTNISANTLAYKRNRKLTNNNHNGIKRFAVVVNGNIIERFSSSKQAMKFANNYEYECLNQDTPTYPEISIASEMLFD